MIQNSTKNYSGFIILDISNFYDFISVGKSKALQSFDTCLSFSNNLSGKLVFLLDSASHLMIILKLLQFTFYSWVNNFIFYYWFDIILNQNIYNTLTIPCEKIKIVSFNSSIMRNIAVFLSQYRFPTKVICCINFGLEPSASRLLKSITIIFFTSTKFFLFCFFNFVLIDQKKFFHSPKHCSLLFI